MRFTMPGGAEAPRKRTRRSPAFATSPAGSAAAAPRASPSLHEHSQDFSFGVCLCARPRIRMCARPTIAPARARFNCAGPAADRLSGHADPASYHARVESATRPGSSCTTKISNPLIRERPASRTPQFSPHRAMSARASVGPKSPDDSDGRRDLRPRSTRPASRAAAKRA